MSDLTLYFVACFMTLWGGLGWFMYMREALKNEE